jgi:superfamily I DNA/RNA helicase
MAWSDGLTGPALEIAAAPESPLLALAGPGTGKTHSLMRRVARLIEEGCPPNQILVVTFARTAARDLVVELQKLAGTGDQVSARTLHSYCFSMLSRANVLEITDRKPRLLAEFERDILLLDLQPDTFGGIRKRRELARAFEAAWARRQTDAPGDPVTGLDQTFQIALLDSLKWHGAMLVGELVPIALHYLRLNPRAQECRAFNHVVVDEFQDLNRAEQELVELLAEAGTLTVMGDDDQSIYGFKWANPEGIRTFETDHPGTRSVPLEECQRCPTKVVEMAATPISHDSNRLPHRLSPRAANGPGEIHHVQWDSLDDEAAGVAAFIQDKTVRVRVPPGQCLVLAPSKIVGYRIRNAMRDQGIPTVSFFREEPVDEEQAQEALTLLILLGDPDDRVALRSWLAFGSSSQRRGGYRHALTMAKSTGTDVGEILRRAERADLTSRTGTSLLHAGGCCSSGSPNFGRCPICKPSSIGSFPTASSRSKTFDTSLSHLSRTRQSPPLQNSRTISERQCRSQKCLWSQPRHV